MTNSTATPPEAGSGFSVRPAGTSDRNHWLDVLRFAAVLLVIGHHLQLPVGSVPISDFLTVWKRGGWVGVDLFFVLSGFLISGLLFQEHLATGRIAVANFLVRRGFKIYPAFWVLLLYTFTVACWKGTHYPIRSWLGELLFLQNYLGPVWPHTWSLAVEEHFYIGIAVLIFFLAARRDRLKAIPWVFVITTLICTGLRAGFATEDNIFQTQFRVDALMAGVLLAYLLHYRQLLGSVRPAALAGVFALGLLLFWPAFAYGRGGSRWLLVLGYNAFYAGSALLVYAAAGASRLQVRFAGPILRLTSVLGAASYSVYLWHMPVNSWSQKILAGHQADWRFYAAYLACYFLGAFGVGYLMSIVIEWPILRVRDRFFPRRQQSSIPS